MANIQTNAPLIINGTAGDDTLMGGAGAEEINGLAGNDSLHGGGGNDTIRGGDGNDDIRGNAGADQIYGGAGTDLYASFLSNWQGDVIHDFEVGERLLIQSNSATELNDYNITFFEGGSAGSGQYIFIFNNGVDPSVTFTINSATPIGHLTLSADSSDANNTYIDFIQPGYHTNTITGTSNADNLEGSNQADIINGLAGNDVLTGKAGHDILVGGSGDDTYVIDGRTADEVHIYDASGADTLQIEDYSGRDSGTVYVEGDALVRISHQGHKTVIHQGDDGSFGIEAMQWISPDVVSGSNTSSVLTFVTDLTNLASSDIAVIGTAGNDTIAIPAASPAGPGNEGVSNITRPENMHFVVYGNDGNDIITTASKYTGWFVAGAGNDTLTALDGAASV
jgi:Ca2+-binding RTX toxin-like protein